METRALGSQGLAVAPVGYGAMGTVIGYGRSEDIESIAAVRRAHELGVTHFDTAAMYGWGEGEKLLGRALAPIRDDVTIATKFGFDKATAPDSRPEYIRDVVDSGLRNLGTDRIDLLYQHVPDPDVPIEDVVGVMKEFVTAGKVAYLGLANTARGFLSSTARPRDQYGADGFRQTQAWWQPENFDANAAIAGELTKLAQDKGVPLSQLALAWLLAKKDYIVPIPGSRNPRRVAQNVAATGLKLTADDLVRIARIAPEGGLGGQPS